MGSRIKENPQKIFDLFFEVTRPSLADDDPQVRRQFPLDFDDQESIQMLPKFCFPLDIERAKECPTVQHFTFALTDMEGKQHFGFCRLAIGFQACLCLLSYLPWFEVFYKILNYIAENVAKEQFTELDEFLSALYLYPVPSLCSPITLEFDSKSSKLKISTETDLNKQNRNRDLNTGTALAYFIAPDPGKLPTIPDNRNLTEFVVAVDVNNMLHLYASLLHERRILLTSSKLSTLTACVQASSFLLYPMYWQHIFIPALPPHLLDYCCAPMPYLIGVHTSLMESVRSKALEDVVILSIDNNTMESPFQDLENLPSDVVSLLKFQLKKQSAATGDGVARAFLRAQALLFGSYREGLVCSLEKHISFSQENFLQQGSGAMQDFLQRAVHLQLFKEFINDRLDKLNADEDFSDLFEQEIDISLSPGSMHSYQLWVESLKKSGGALISTMKNKTNPAVKNAYQYAKGHAKIHLKNIRSRIKDSSLRQSREQEQPLNVSQISSPILPTRNKQSENLQRRLPITQHFGKSRPRRPQRTNSETELETQRDVSTPFKSTSPDSSVEPAGGESYLNAEKFDLLGEIFETLNLLESSQAQQPLYGTRSLDFCNLEEENFYTKRPSREALYEALSEEQDDAEDSLSEDRVFLGYVDEENMSNTLLLSARAASTSNEGLVHSSPELQGCPGLDTTTLSFQEASNEPSEAALTQKADLETAFPSPVTPESHTATKLQQEYRTDQNLQPPINENPKVESLVASSSTIQTSADFLQTKANDSVAKKSILGRVTSLPPRLVSRQLMQPKVLELKKRFEA
ncbi:DENN domain-containing protein 1C isoform X2 [Ahaetulla prasina]|uniref:DENN domain-containing protein 1C isoform X2 n=1 Tax=Ahaetulla prasina TaxID=499056 RepID=UPI0026495F58|nr:DENN domain-containing protein 1C isoform X2 [Ahaetulla prasina]